MRQHFFPLPHNVYKEPQTIFQVPPNTPKIKNLLFGQFLNSLHLMDLYFARKHDSDQELTKFNTVFPLFFFDTLGPKSSMFLEVSTKFVLCLKLFDNLF